GLPSAPIHSSTQATSMPCWAARIAAAYPAGPAPMTMRSNRLLIALASAAARSPSCAVPSHLEQEACRVLQQVPYRRQEKNGLAAVDETVIVRQGEVHHGSRHDLPVDHHRPLLDPVHPENGALRRIEYRRREERSEHAAVGDGEGTAGNLLDRERAVL